jgi:hypothetical protein
MIIGGQEYGKALRALRHALEDAHEVLSLGEWPKGDVCHKCDNRSCVNPNHLFDGTRKENNEDKARKGRGTARLTEQQVLEIRKKYKAGVTQRALAEEYGIGQSNIGKITLGRTYKYIPMETP